MADPELLLRHLLALVPDSSVERAGDAELLDRFAHNHDDVAFSALVARHGPMVYGVCRRTLREAGAAEDVAQATFLVLARKAKSIRPFKNLAGWLHRTAHLLSLKYREGEARRRQRETRSLLSAPARTGVDPLDELSARELLTIFDEELQRLPERYRLPIVLCCLEGCSQDEAARQLGWTPGSVKGRLERGRAMLHDRLVRRGLSLSAALVGVEAVHGVSYSAGFIVNTTRAALLFATGIGAVDSGAAKVVMEIAEEGIRNTALSRAKILLSLLLMVSLVTAGFAVVAHQDPAATPPAGKQTTVAVQPAEKPPAKTDLHGDPLPAGGVARLGSLRWRVGREVEALAFSPDGKTVACANLNGVFLFDRDGKLVKTIPSAKTSYYPGAFSPYHRLAFSPDGRHLACWSMVGPPVEKQVMHVLLQMRSEPRTQKSVQPVGKRVVQIWDLPEGHMAKEHDADELLWLGWSAAGEPLAVNLVKEGLLFRELATGKQRRLAGGNFRPTFNEYYACAYASGAKVLAVVDTRGVIHVWDTSTGKERFALETNAQYVPSLALSSDGGCLAALTHPDSNKDRVEFWDLTTGKTTRTVEAGAGGSATQFYLETLAFSPDGKTLAMVGRHGIGFHDVAAGRERSRIYDEQSFTRNVIKEQESFARNVAFSPDGKTLAAMKRPGTTIQLWDVATASLKPAAAGHTGNLTHIVFSPDGRRVVTGSRDGTMIHWDTATGKPLLPAKYSNPCGFPADGRVFLSVTKAGDLEYSDTSTGRVLNKIKLPVLSERRQLENHDVHLSSDRKTLVVVSGGGRGPGSSLLITGWDVETRKELFRRRRDAVYLGGVVSADLKTFAFRPTNLPSRRNRPLDKGVESNLVRLEDLATGENLLSFPKMEREAMLKDFSPDGRFLVTSSFSRPRAIGDQATLQLWEVITGSEALSISGGFNVAFSPDGRLLAISDYPTQEIVLWDLWRSKERQRFKGFNAHATNLAFSPDGKRLISGLSNSTLLVWEVAAEQKAGTPTSLDAAGANKAWADLAGDARKAFAARGALALSPEAALPVLKKHLKPVQPGAPAMVRRLLAVTDPETLRSLRAIAVLEDLGTPEAKKILETLAKGSAEARLTREAKTTLERMAK